MKFEALVTAFAPGVNWFDGLAPVWKPLTALGICLALGFGIGGATVSIIGLPETVTSNEARIEMLEADRAEDRCLLRRVICRLDGISALTCDLRHVIRDGRCVIGGT